MTKIAVITDTHWGVRSESEFFMSNMKSFLDNTFFPYIDQHEIKHIIHCGDIVDRRKYVSYLTAKRLREDFIEPLVQRGIRLDIIAGNHDLYYKQKNHVNALKELLEHYDNINIFLNAAEIEVDNIKLLYVPWIVDENKEHSFELIKNTKAKVVFGHLELSGFEMFKGVTNNHGDDPHIFTKFELVCSGHYHHRSSFNNIHYLGAAGQYTWADFGDSRGFHIFNTSDRQLHFIENPFKVFEKVYYNDSGRTKKELLKETDFASCAGKYIKIIVQAKTNTKLFDIYTAKIEEQNPINVQIVDDHLQMDILDNDEIQAEVKDTLTLFREYIHESNSIINAERLDNLIVSLYNEAQNLDE